MKAIKWLDKHFEETLIVIILIIITVVEFAQVVVRKLPFIPAFTWAEEFCRICWIWTVFLTIPYTIRHMNMLRVSIVMEQLPSLVRNIWNVVIDLINCAVYGFLCYHSFAVVANIKEGGQFTAAMQWPLWIINIVVIVGFGLGALRALQVAIIHLMHVKEKTLSSKEQAIKDAEEEAEAAKRAEGLVEEGGKA